MCVAFATSCDAPIFVGDSFGSVGVAGFVGVDGASTKDCYFTSGSHSLDGCDACADKAKLVELTLTYTGAPDVSTFQSSDKYAISGDAQYLDLVDVQVTDVSADEVVVGFFPSVPANGSFTILAAAFASGVFPNMLSISIFDGTLIRKKSASSIEPDTDCEGVACILFTTSCSEPVTRGDAYSAIIIEGFRNRWELCNSQVSSTHCNIIC